MHDFDPFERRLAAALRFDADRQVNPSDTASVARAAIASHPRRDARFPWRLTTPATFRRFAGTVAIGMLVLVGASFLFQLDRPALVGSPTPTPNGTPDPSTPAPSAGPTESSAASPTGSWVATGSMGTPRVGHTAVRLLDGRVLVMGGYRPSVRGDAGRSLYLTSAELYDPDTGTWSATGEMKRPPDGPAVLLRDGRVLVGDIDDHYALDPTHGLEIYDPTTGAWTASRQRISPDVWAQTATLLRDGTVFVTNGEGTWLYEPDSGTWTDAHYPSDALPRPAVVQLPDGRVLMVKTMVTSDKVEIYDPSTRTWGPASGFSQDHFDNARATLLADGTVFLAGHEFGAPPSFVRYDPVTDTWATIWTGSTQAPLTLPPWVAELADGGVLPLGYSGYPLGDGQIVYDPASGTWTSIATLMQSEDFGAALSTYSATPLLDGSILVAGGTVGETLDHGGVSTDAAQLYVPGGGR